MLSDAQILKKFGQPGENFAMLEIPYPMRIAWDLNHSVTKIQCHKFAIGSFLSVFSDLKAHYGYDKIKELGIDLYGGCVNVRKMRGSTTKWSRHSWGIAIDLDPTRNGLKTKKPIAQFSKPEYKPMIDIFYKNGFINYGVEKDYDWMHFEINKI